MKKSIICSLAAVAASALISGCAMIESNCGVPTPGIGVIFSQQKGNALLQQPTTDDYTVLAHNVKGVAEATNVFMLVSFGDVSYNALKADALRSVPGADDIIDVKIDYKSENIIGVHKMQVVMTGTAIKYKK